MAHSYRTLQQWNQWLSHQAMGHQLLTAEKENLSQLLQQHFGKHAILIGTHHQQDLLSATPIANHSIISPFPIRNGIACIESNFHELPLLSGSVDLVILPHTLEFIDNPRQLLAEACRVIKPEGLIAICGFNPYSPWGMKKIFTKDKEIPWDKNVIQPHKLKGWLQLADFVIEQQTGLLFRPPIKHSGLYQRLKFLEGLGKKCFPLLGGVYVIIARAKVIPLTPIRLKWKQRLGSIQITTTMPGHIARNVK